MKEHHSRREFLQIIGLGAASMGVGLFAGTALPVATTFASPVAADNPDNQPLGIEQWLLSTGQTYLDSDLVAAVQESLDTNWKVHLPLVIS